MVRPSPIEMLKHTRKSDYMTTVVVAADKFYGITYEGEPIYVYNDSDVTNKIRKYKRIASVKPAHLQNFVDELNEIFKTDKFELRELKIGKKYGE